MNILIEFQDYEDSIRSEVETVKGLLSAEISDEPEKLVHDLTAIEAYNARIGVFLAKSNYFLDVAKSDLLPEKEHGTELDRRTKLDELVAPVRCVRDTLESLSDSIRQRLIACESILSYMRVYKDHGIMGGSVPLTHNLKPS